jgi:hypothetical protein
LTLIAQIALKLKTLDSAKSAKSASNLLLNLRRIFSKQGLVLPAGFPYTVGFSVIIKRLTFLTGEESGKYR